MTDHAALVQAWLESRAEDMAVLLEQLVGVDSENPPGRELGKCARVLAEAMDALSLKPEVLKVASVGTLEDANIVRGTVGDGQKLLYFHGHFDVVPAQDRRQFAAERRDGRIIGRGTADMKGGIVSMLYGAAAAKDLGLLEDGRIVVHLVCDEETGSVVGAGHLRDAGLIDSQAVAMVTGEPSGGSIWNAARGAISIRVDVEGREAHVGQANLGVNAFAHLLHVAQAVMAYAEQMAGRATGFPMNADDARGTMLVVGGKFGGGSNFNVVPGSGYFTVDGRYNPEENLDHELERLIGIVKAAAKDVGATVSVSVTQMQSSANTEQTHPAAASLAQVVKEIEGSEPLFEMCAGILETRWYTQLGIPAFGYGAGRLDVSHGPNEYVDEAAMRRCAAVYALYANEMLSRSN
jgi:succinyl-diaminopimelate desuccinylase